MHVPVQKDLDTAKTLQMQRQQHLDVAADGVMIGSTGVIGKQIPDR